MHPIQSLRVFLLLLGSIAALMAGLYYEDNCYQPFMRRSLWLCLTGCFGIIGFLVVLAREYSLLDWLRNHGYRSCSTLFTKRWMVATGIFWFIWTIIGAIIFWGPYTSSGCTEGTPLKQFGTLFVSLLAGAFVWIYMWQFARRMVFHDREVNQTTQNESKQETTPVTMSYRSSVSSSHPPSSSSYPGQLPYIQSYPQPPYQSPPPTYQPPPPNYHPQYQSYQPQYQSYQPQYQPYQPYQPQYQSPTYAPTPPAAYGTAPYPHSPQNTPPMFYPPQPSTSPEYYKGGTYAIIEPDYSQQKPSS